MTFRVAVGCDGCGTGIVGGNASVQFVELVRHLEMTCGWTARRSAGGWLNYCSACSEPPASNG